jgi:hypothetical protein
VNLWALTPQRGGDAPTLSNRRKPGPAKHAVDVHYKNIKKLRFASVSIWFSNTETRVSDPH